MALSDITLNKGEVVVTLSSSSLNIAAAGVALNFGTVQSINDLCDSVSVGNSIWFNIKDAIPFMLISGITYYRLNESDIAGIENFIP